MSTATDSRLVPYSEFRPTGFDPAGLGLADRQEWLVCPVSKTRDSVGLAVANYDSQAEALAEIDPEGDDHEEHTFGHWGPGWFSIVIVRPGTECERVAEGLAERLEDYPVLDYERHAEQESEEENESWKGWARREFVDAIRKSLSLRDENGERLDETDPEKVRALFDAACKHANAYVEHTEEGPRFPAKRAAVAVTAEILAEFFRRVASGMEIR